MVSVWIFQTIFSRLPDNNGFENLENKMTVTIAVIWCSSLLTLGNCGMCLLSDHSKGSEIPGLQILQIATYLGEDYRGINLRNSINSLMYGHHYASRFAVLEK